MKFLLSWLHEMLPNQASAKEVSEALISVGIEVSECRNLSEGFEKIVAAKIEAVEKHPDADRLTLCRVFDGQKIHAVVCGAKNHKAGDIACFAPAGATIPNGMTLKRNKIRGVESEGMLCSESEMKLSEESDGILILPPESEIGMNVAKILGLDDWVLEVELTPNRGDCLSLSGLAREVCAALGISPRVSSSAGDGPKDSNLKVHIADTEGCSRYVLRHLQDVKITSSSNLVQRRLQASDIRPINNVVDITNYVCLEWGQPMHAFDADKVQGMIQVRCAKAEERILCLDGIERELSVEDLVIADDTGPIAIAGVIGGESTAVTESTQSVFLESACFHPSRIRRTARRLGLQTEASYRFERSVNPSTVWEASNRAVELMESWLGATHVAAMDEKKGSFEEKNLLLRSSTLKRILGEDIKGAGEYLARLGLSVSKLDEGWSVQIPLRRPDIEREIDLVEEVARIHGYQKFASAFPTSVDTEFQEGSFERLQTMRNHLQSLGLSEAVSYSFSSETDLKALDGESVNHAIALSNPVLVEDSWLRASLLPNLFKVARSNLARQQEGVRLFEIGRTYGRSNQTDSMAKETMALAAVWAGVFDSQTWFQKERKVDFFDAKGAFEALAEKMSWKGFQYRKENLPAYFHPGKSVAIFFRNQLLGFLGEIHPSLGRTYDLKEGVIALEIQVEPLLEAKKEVVSYRPFSVFPTVRRDLAFLQAKEEPSDAIVKAIKKLQDPIIQDVEIFDIYEGKGVEKGMQSRAYRLTLGAKDRTLKEEEIERSIQTLVASLSKSLQVRLR